MNEPRWSPLDIQVVIHHNVGPAPFPHPSPVYTEAVTRLHEAGLIWVRHVKETPEGTPLGRAFLALLCRTPLPEQKWTDPRDGAVLEVW